MKGFWNRMKAKFGRQGRPALESGDFDGEEAPYQVRDTSPASQLAVRVALWGLVGIGAVGGIVGMVRPSAGTTQVVSDDSKAENDASAVPAPVTSVAERAVGAWLTATPEDEELLAELFAEPPEPKPESAPLKITEMTAVAGGQWEDGYWVVTLAVELSECLPFEGEEDQAEELKAQSDLDCADVADSATAEDSEGSDSTSEEGDDGGSDGPLVPQATTWFVEVGVVGDINERVAVLGTPSVLAEPPTVSGWGSQGAGRDAPNFDDPLTHTVEEFLQGWLAGTGDPARYVAPGVEVTPANPPLFAELRLVGLNYQEQEDDKFLIRAHAEGTSEGGVTVSVSYELEAAYFEDRWEIHTFWGAPSLSRRPGDEPTGDGPAEEDSADDVAEPEESGEGDQGE